MSLIDEIKIKSLSDAQEILKAAGTEDILDFEKAHKDGDLHPNGKYVWVSSANGGRGDWRTLNGRTHKKHQAANAAGGNGVVSGSAASTTTGGKSSSVKTTSSKSKKSSSVKIDIDTIDQDEYNRIYKQAKSVDKQGRSMGLSVITSNINKYKKDLEETISNRPGAKATIKKLQDNLTKFISQKKAVEDAIGEINNSKTTSSINPTFQKYFSINNSKFTDPKKMSVSKTPQGNWSLSYEGKRISTVAPLTDADKKELESAGVTFDDTFKPKQKVKTNSETYSHDINGVSVNVSKNKDGSYTLEANGKKVKSDDPSFFRDKLLPRVKKALAKEVGIETSMPKKTSAKKTSKSQTFEAQNASDYDKGDGKIGNYAKPETRSYRADALLRMMKNNIHLGFKYGMDSKKINEALEARGDKLVTVTMHKNGGSNDIYRVKFD